MLPDVYYRVKLSLAIKTASCVWSGILWYFGSVLLLCTKEFNKNHEMKASCGKPTKPSTPYIHRYYRNIKS